MEIVQNKEDSVMTVSLNGRLDAASAKTVEDHLLGLVEAGERRIVLDLSGMDYVSSVGLRVLMVLAKRLKPLGGSVVVCGLQDSIRQVFQIAGFGSIFQTYPSRGDALASMQ